MKIFKITKNVARKKNIKKRESEIRIFEELDNNRVTNRTIEFSNEVTNTKERYINI